MADLMQTVLSTASADQAKVAKEICDLIKSNGVKLCESHNLFAKIAQGLDDTSTPVVKEGALVLVRKLAEIVGAPLEAQLVALLPTLLLRVGDKGPAGGNKAAPAGSKAAPAGNKVAANKVLGGPAVSKVLGAPAANKVLGAPAANKVLGGPAANKVLGAPAAGGKGLAVLNKAAGPVLLNKAAGPVLLNKAAAPAANGAATAGAPDAGTAAPATESTAYESVGVPLAAEAAAKAVVGMICPHAVPLVLPVLVEGARNHKSWKTQEAALLLVGHLALNGPRQVAAALHVIVPLLSEYMIEGKAQVRCANAKSLAVCINTLGRGQHGRVRHGGGREVGVRAPPLVLKRRHGLPLERQRLQEGEQEGSLGYGGKILLSATRLWLKRGRRYGLCGHNGCGKSTLMRAIANGKLDGFPSADVLRTVYVEHDLDSSVVDRSPVDYLLEEEALKGKVDEAEVVRELGKMGFGEDRQRQPITALSGGWKMKLALARAMLIGADILLLDEPTNHMDTTNVEWLQRYLTGLKTLSCLIVSHDSGFLDAVCTDIIHYEKRKLKHYRGNLSAFVKVNPAGRVYYDLAAAPFKYKLPTPGQLDGIRRKESPILKLTNVSFTYPEAPTPALSNVHVQCSLGSRVAVVGVNGAGKSTLIKLITGESKPTAGTIWRHPNLGMAYVAQHAFHHVEQHLDKSPNEYIRWRFARGEDREELNKVFRKIGKEEAKSMEELIMHNGQRKQVEQLQSRRKSKKSYEYEVKWVGLKPVFNSWLSRELLEDLGFEKLVHDVDAKEVARLGVYGRPLTIAGVQEHFDNFGLDAEFGTYGQIKNLSGGQKVKVVLAAAMWSNPHMIVLDEPTNYLDRDSLAALVGAINDYEGAVVVISHNKEFLASLTNETWTVENKMVIAPGNPAYEKALKAGGKKK
ncbi:unnamed protein product [Closterium sp. NIES-54]